MLNTMAPSNYTIIYTHRMVINSSMSTISKFTELDQEAQELCRCTCEHILATLQIPQSAHWATCWNAFPVPHYTAITIVALNRQQG